MQQNTKKWWFYLLMIPVVLLGAGVVFASGALLDGALLRGGEGTGHPFPVFSLLAILLSAVILVGGLIYVLIGLFRSLFHRSAPNVQPGASGTAVRASAGRNPMVLLPIPISVVISLVIVFLVGSWEISSFYNNPEHIGFAVPIVTFLLAAVFFLICLVVLIICLVLYFRRPKQNAAEQVICPSCGMANRPSDSFCTRCGTRLH